MANVIMDAAESLITRVKPREEQDLINLILEDHKPLKELIQVMKDPDTAFAERKIAFENFATQLTLHAKPEEQTMYRSMKASAKTAVEGLEGDVEHGLADQLCEEIKRTSDTKVYIAKTKVLAEMVEHHIKEEESQMLKDFEKLCSTEARIKLGETYIHLQEELLSKGGTDAPSEKDIN